MTTKAAKALSELVKGSSKLSEVGKELKRTGGQSQFERLERAADEVPDLEQQYTAEALLRAFEGRLGSPYRGVITINPADFERYARPLPDPIDTYSADNINDLRRIFRQSGKDTQGFDDVLFLDLGASKGEVPLIRGHEGRHRSRALAAEGQGKTLVEVLPRGDLMEYPKGYTRLSPEEWREAVNKLLEERGRMVGAEDMVVKKPLYEVLEKQRKFLAEQGDYQGVKDINEEIRRLGYEGSYEADPKSLVPFPEVFAKGGVVRRQEGSPQEGEISEGEIARRTLDFLRKQESSKFEGLSKQPRLDLPKVTKDVVRGVQYTPFDVLGAPVDIATMAMRPFGYNVEKPVGGSDYLIEQAAKVGLAQPQTGSVAEFAGRVLGGGLAPVVASKTGKIGEATEEFIKAELAKPPEGAVKNPFGFFSPLEDVVSDLPQAKGTANQYLAQISKAKGIKSDELNATGLKEFLASRGNAPLTKQEIQDFIAQNEVKVDEVMLGKGPTLSPEAKRLSDEAFSRMEVIDNKLAPFFERALANNEGIGGQEPFSLFARLRGPVARKAARGDQEALAELESLNLPPEIRDLVLEYGRNKNEYVKYTSQARKMQTPRFDEYNIPGGTNPREIYLTLPFKEPAIPEGYKVTPVQYDDGTRYFAETPTTRSQAFKTEQEAMSSLQEQITNLRGFRENQNALFTAPPGHSVSPEADRNRVAHIFLDDRTDSEGKKVLFVQEMQSDWGQQGRDKGFAKTFTPDQLKAEEVLPKPPGPPVWTVTYPDGNQSTFAAHTADEAIASAIQREGNIGAPPPAPFVTSTEGWVNLALKRVINEAVENGYDKVAFISGQQAANKYRLSTVLDGIEVSPLPTTYISSTRQVSPGSRVVELKQKGGGIIETYVDKDGTVEAVANESFRQFTGKPLSEIIGKEMSEKIMAAKPSEGGSVSFGVKDMEVGGEGMKGFYDNVLPKTANKLLAKLGSKIEPVDVVKGAPSQMPFESNSFLDWMQQNHPGTSRADAARAWGMGIDNNMFVREFYEATKADQQLGFKITPEMVEMVKTKGLPLFAEGGPVTTDAFIKRALA